MSRIERRRFLDDLAPRARLQTRPSSADNQALRSLGLAAADIEALDGDRDGVISGRQELSALYDHLVALDATRPVPSGQLDRTEQMHLRLAPQASARDAAPASPAPSRQARGSQTINGTDQPAYVFVDPSLAAAVDAQRGPTELDPRGRARRGEEPVQAYLLAMEAREAGQAKPAGVSGTIWNTAAALEKRGIDRHDVEHYLITGRLADLTDAEGTVLVSGQQRLQTLENAARREGSWTAVNSVTFLVNMRRAQIHGVRESAVAARDSAPADAPNRAQLDARVEELRTAHADLRGFLNGIYANATNARERRAGAAIVGGDRYARQAEAARGRGDAAAAAQLEQRAEASRSRGARMAHAEATYRGQFSHSRADAARTFDLAAQAQIARGHAEVAASRRSIGAPPEAAPATLGMNDGSAMADGVPGAGHLLESSGDMNPDGGINHRTLGLQGARQASLSDFHRLHLERGQFFDRATPAATPPAVTPQLAAHAQSYVDARVGQGVAATQRLELYGDPAGLEGDDALDAAGVAREHRQVVDELSASMGTSMRSGRASLDASGRHQELSRAVDEGETAISGAEGSERETNEGLTRAQDGADAWFGDTFKTRGEASRDGASVRDAQALEDSADVRLTRARARLGEMQDALPASQARRDAARTQSRRDQAYGDMAKQGLRALGVTPVFDAATTEARRTSQLIIAPGDRDVYRGARAAADRSADMQGAYLVRAAADVPEPEAAERQLMVAGQRLELSAYHSRAPQSDRAVLGRDLEAALPHLRRADSLLGQVDAVREGLDADSPDREDLAVGLIYQRSALAEAESIYRPAQAHRQLAQAEGIIDSDLADSNAPVRADAHGRVGQAAIRSVLTQEQEFTEIFQSGQHQMGAADDLYAMAVDHLGEEVSDTSPRTVEARSQLSQLQESLRNVPEVFRVSAAQMEAGSQFAAAQVGSMGFSEVQASSAKLSSVGTGLIWAVTDIDVREWVESLVSGSASERQAAIRESQDRTNRGARQLTAGWEAAESHGARFDYLHGLRMMSRRREVTHDDVPGAASQELRDSHYGALVDRVDSFIPEAMQVEHPHDWVGYLVNGSMNPDTSRVPLAASLGGPAHGFTGAMAAHGNPEDAAVTEFAQTMVQLGADSLQESTENLGWWIAFNTAAEVALGLVLTAGIGSGVALAEAGNAVNAGRSGLQAVRAVRSAQLLARAGTALRTARAAHPVLYAMGVTTATGATMIGAQHVIRRAVGANTSLARGLEAATNFLPIGAGQRAAGMTARYSRIAQAGMGGTQAALTTYATMELSQQLGVRSEAGQAAIGLALNAIVIGGFSYHGARASQGRRLAAENVAGRIMEHSGIGNSRLQSRRVRSDVETFLRRTEGRVPTDAEVGRLRSSLHRRLGIPEGTAGEAARGHIDVTVEALRVDMSTHVGMTAAAQAAAGPDRARAALGHAGEALYQARGGSEGGASRVQAHQDAAAALARRYLQEGDHASAYAVAERFDAAVVAEIASTGRRPAVNPTRRRAVEQTLVEHGHLTQAELQTRLVQDAGLNPTVARQVAEASVTRRAHRQAQRAADTQNNGVALLQSLGMDSRPTEVRLPNAQPRPIDDAVAHEGPNPAEHLQLLAQYDLQTQHVVQVGEASYSFTDPIDVGGGRLAVLAVVDTPQGSHLRAFYRSNSQGEFRALPAINDGIPGIPRYDKGPGETALSLPPEVNQRLAQLTNVRRDIPAAAANRMFEGAVLINRTRAEFMAHYRQGALRSVEINPLVRPPAGAVEHPRPRGGPVLDPSALQIPEPQRPDFGADPILSYETDTATAGRVNAEVFRSNDGSLDYTIFRDAENRAWVANVGPANAEINSHGLRNRTVDPDALTTPRWEYGVQIPNGFAGAQHPQLSQYSDAWAYVREIPLIQDYYRARGEQVP